VSGRIYRRSCGGPCEGSHLHGRSGLQQVGQKGFREVLQAGGGLAEGLVCGRSSGRSSARSCKPKVTCRQKVLRMVLL
jgi:hypothetical protein